MMQRTLCLALLLLSLPVAKAATAQETARLQIRSQALALTQTPAEREAVSFLYDYMSWPDVADYTPDFYVGQTRCTLRAREEMPWGKNVPEREWRHFVLPLRVNNEHLDSFRTACYDELARRVSGLSMQEAALEVNHWCHEYVTYKPSDARTSSPLASMRTAYGRCGEESTFTVSALRAVGIPARQVYTPRWAHTDDNHAWVEVWVDGGWHFLGACEPEPVLDLGWFNQPASRGMMMHTRVFGRYDGPEDKVSFAPTFTEINVTPGYAETTRTHITTEPGATVEFKLYNYGEFYTIYRTTADSAGRASIVTGMGDMIVWASARRPDGAVYGVRQVHAGCATTVPLDRREGDSWQADYTLTPPAGTTQLPAVSPEAAALNERRKATEDSLRTAYVATFPQGEELIRMSRGNHANVSRLLEKYGQAGRTLLRTLSEKDLRDLEFDVIDHHLQNVSLPLITDEPLYARYVACPRIATEHLSAWRKPLQEAFTPKQKDSFRENPALLAEWLRTQVETDSVWNPSATWLSPEKALRHRCCDVRNKGLLFVAAARSLGIMARIDEVTGLVQYADPDTPPFGDEPSWLTARLQDAAPAEPSRTGAEETSLALTYTPRQYMENPAYYYHFTLSRLEAGSPRLQEYGEEDSWQGKFQGGQPLAAGPYVLVSGTRMADGSVLAHLEAFRAEGSTTVPLVMRQDTTGVQVIGQFNSENLYAALPSGQTQSILAHTGRGYYVVGLIRANHEPSNHVLHDLEQMRSELEAWGRPILLLFPDVDEYLRFKDNSAEFTNLPATLSFGIDSTGAIAAEIASAERPAILIGDTFNRVVFRSEGYTIGIGDKLMRTIGKLKP